MPRQAKETPGKSAAAAAQKVWDLAKRGKPACSICLDLALRPVRLPCKCATLMCFGCFENFMQTASACCICRERIVTKLRRECKGGPLDVLVDSQLDTWIRNSFATELDKAGASDVDPAEELRVKQSRADAPAPGELKRMCEALEEQHRRARLAEEQATLKFLESLKETGDDDLVELERIKRSEEFAIRLEQQLRQEVEAKQRFDQQSAEDEKLARQLAMEEEAAARKPKTITLASINMMKDDEELARKLSHQPNETSMATTTTSMSNQDDEVVVVAVTNSHSTEKSQQCGEESPGLTPSSQGSEDGQQQIESNHSGKKKRAKVKHPNDGNSNTRVTWSCKVCTYAFTDVKWLRCELCNNPKY